VVFNRGNWVVPNRGNRAVSGDHLLTATRKLLYENRFVIPGTRRLSNLMQAAVSSVEHDALSAIERTIPILIRNRWLDAGTAGTNSRNPRDRGRNAWV
jgi:hypothetical protein